MTDRRITIATIQPPYPASSSVNAHMDTRERGLHWLRRAAEEKCRFICLPEYFNCVALNPADMRTEARQGNTLISLVAEIAKASQAYIILPIAQERDGLIYNTSLLLDPKGDTIFQYDKTHLTRVEREEYGFTPGDVIDAFTTDLTTLGFATCYDAYFPEVFRVLALKGARLIFFPSLQRSEDADTILRMTAMRAMDSWAWVVRSAYACTSNAGWPAGCSCIAHPNGSILANAQSSEGYVKAEINLDFAWQRPRSHGQPTEPVRGCHMEDRRPELYRPLSNL
jgi:predicted amidohydrolase